MSAQNKCQNVSIWTPFLATRTLPSPPLPCYLRDGRTKVAVREDTRQTDVAGAAAPGAVKHSVSRFSDHFWVPFGGKTTDESRQETGDSGQDGKQIYDSKETAG